MNEPKSPLMINGVPRWVREKRKPTEEERHEWDCSFGPVMFTGLCDDCVDKGDREEKTVKRIEGDGIAFCRHHWKLVVQSFRDAGEFCEPFDPQ